MHTYFDETIKKNSYIVRPIKIVATNSEEKKFNGKIYKEYLQGIKFGMKSIDEE